MKWMIRIGAVLGILVVGLGLALLGTAHRSDAPVGFQVVRVDGPAGPFAAAIWYPTSERPRPTVLIGGKLLNVARDAPVLGNHLPVIVLSHGNGGSATSHVDLALALASRGYVVVAPTHRGDNPADTSRQSSPRIFADRADEFRATLDHALTHWPNAGRIDPTRVGAFGFSAGGFTVLALAGGHPDLRRIRGHCLRTPEFICAALAQAKSPLRHNADGAGAIRHDPRLRAAVVAAPGLGFTFADGGLAEVRIPVQVWNGERDETVPFASNAGVVIDGLNCRAETHSVPGASHLSFLAPCGLLRPPGLCTDPDGFDRAAAHQRMNAAIVRFFDTALARPPKS